MKEVNVYTVFQHQATLWKVIPCAKVITWQAQSMLLELNKLVQAKIPAGLEKDAAAAAKHEGQAKVKRYLDAAGEEYQEALRVLTRFSKKWH